MEFQHFSGNEFYATSVNCAFAITVILLAIKFASWLFNDSEKYSNVTVNVITVSSTPLGIAKEVRIEDEKERKDRAVKAFVEKSKYLLEKCLDLEDLIKLSI